MKKSQVFIAALLIALMAAFSAYATAGVESLSPVSESETLLALFDQITNDMSEPEIQAFIKEFIENLPPTQQAGEIISDIYVHPMGYFFQIPGDYQVLQDPLGATVQLVGPTSEGGFAPTIHVMVLDAPQEDFENLTQSKVDAYFGPLLENYQFVALDHFDYNNVTAHEFICLHGASEDDMMVQHSLCFNKGDKAYILTMTTLAEEATLQYALQAYDIFIEGFFAPDVVDAGAQENG